MPKLMSYRDMTVKSLSGHVIRFKAKVPVHVPPMMVDVCMSRGAVPADDEAEQQVSQPVEKKAKAAPEGDARKQRLFDIFDGLVAENARGTFTAGGAPKVGVVREKFGFDVDTPEVRKLWDEYIARESGSEATFVGEAE